MNLRAFALALILAFSLLALFATLNWAAMAAPTTLNLGYAEVSAPLGTVMLIVTAAISGLFVVFIVIQQAGVILQARRFAKELQAQRELADKAEASRFTELKAFMELGLRNIEAQGIAANRDFTTRLEQSDQGLQDQLAQATRTVSAYLGEIEDKLDRALTAPRA